MANAFGGKAQAGFSASADERARAQAALMHWLRAVAVLALLVVMIYKPGA